MKAVICFLSAFAITSGRVVSGITSHDIDLLIRDALRSFRTIWKSYEPLEGGSPLMFALENDDLNLIVELRDMKIWIGETDSYSESSNLTDDNLLIQIDATQKHMKTNGIISVKGYVKGETINENGKFELYIPNNGQKLDAIFSISPDSLSLTNWDILIHHDRPIIYIKGIEVHGLSHKLLSEEIIDTIVRILKDSETRTRNQIPAFITEINEQIKGESLQEIYESLREQFPAT